MPDFNGFVKNTYNTMVSGIIDDIEIQNAFKF